MTRPASRREGFVYLVGAGPGDPDLLTVKAVKALQRAEVILCDELVSAEVLAHANPAARIVHVGKRGGGKSTPQVFIERLMVAEARAGRVVARLKGGDPMIFGRGGEECAALERAGIGFEVVNGITSGLAAATALGIPLTHRDAGQGAILLNGHERGDAAIDWEALVRTGMPLVIYMGVARCEAIVAALLAAGMDPSMPAAAVQNATRPDARQRVTRLDALPATLRAAGIGSPAILIVGRTVRAVQAELAERVQALP